MDWIKTTITTTGEGIDAVSGRLLDLGINGIEIADKDDFKEFLESNRKYWDYVDEELERLKDADTQITFYLSCGAAGMEQLSAVKVSMEELKKLDTDGIFGKLDIITENVKDEDWSEIW
ncbi:MAG: 50S ribosomal protein L11 methyltransferase, partial [Oscillospiraceae bacterium]|nr:50S ribosomal protein L11 methyltransferase [Oscillospiraceae bacterium]